MIRINLSPPQQQTRHRRAGAVLAFGAAALLASAIGIGTAHYFKSRAPAQELIQLIDLGEPIAEDPNKPRCEGEAKKIVDIYADGIASSSKHRVNRALEQIEKKSNDPNAKQFLHELGLCLKENEYVGPIVNAYSFSRGTPAGATNLERIADATLEVRTNPDAERRYGKKFFEATTKPKKAEKKDENGLSWYHLLFVGIIAAGYAVIRMITNIKPEEKKTKEPDVDHEDIDTEQPLDRTRATRKLGGSETEADRLLHEIFDDLAPQERQELLQIQYMLSYQRTLEEYLSMEGVIERGVAEVTLRRAKYFVKLSEDAKREVIVLTEQLADRLLSWARSESIDRSFNYQREKYISAMLWDILKYDAHVDGAVTIKNQRKPVFNNISDLQEASFIRDAGIDLSVPERLTESELQTIIDNCYFDVSPIGRGPDVRLRQELTIQRMKQWFKNEQ